MPVLKDFPLALMTTLLNLKQNPLRTTNTSGVIRVFHKNHNLHDTNSCVTIAGVPSGTHNGIAHTDINGTYTSISNITLDSYDITTSGTATSTGDIGGTAFTATQNRQFDVLNLGGLQNQYTVLKHLIV